jgi:hypothetical protein
MVLPVLREVDGRHPSATDLPIQRILRPEGRLELLAYVQNRHWDATEAERAQECRLGR